MNTCLDCGRPARAYRSPMDGQPRCPACARREVLDLLSDAEPESLGKLRRRAEDLLRKNPLTTHEVITDFAVKGKIRWTDCV